MRKDNEKRVRGDHVVAPCIARRGKSELHRAGWSVTQTGGNPRESATERETTLKNFFQGKGEKVR
jgi:hypothetical protein